MLNPILPGHARLFSPSTPRPRLRSSQHQRYHHSTSLRIVLCRRSPSVRFRYFCRHALYAILIVFHHLHYFQWRNCGTKMAMGVAPVTTLPCMKASSSAPATIDVPWKTQLVVGLIVQREWEGYDDHFVVCFYEMYFVV